MNSSPITDAALKEAAGRVCQAMLDALPEPEGCAHRPSPAFHAKIMELIRRERRAAALRRAARRAACAALAVLIAASSWLAVDAEARAAFFSWVREVYEEHIVYRFFGEPAADELPAYRITWLPEGYEEVDVHESETAFNAFYQKGDDVMSGFVFEYVFAQEGTLMEMQIDEANYVHKIIDIKGIQADFYLARNPDETNDLVWFDADSNIMFSLNGFLEETVMLHIAQSVILTDLTK